MGIIVSGGLRRSNHSELKSGQKNHLARLLELDNNQKNSSVLFDYRGEGGVYPDILPGVRFTAACKLGQYFLLPTPTEVLLWCPKLKKILSRITHPMMNDVHSVASHDGILLITNTGLDAVLRYELKTQRWLSPMYLADGDIHTRLAQFDVQDFRCLHSTGSHQIHPNFVASVQEKFWITCGQIGSIWSEETGFVKLIDNIIHDGIIWDGYLVYSTIEGVLLFCDPLTGELRETVTPIIEERGKYNLGWCRGLYFSGHECFLGFSSSRPSSRGGQFQASKLTKLLTTHIAVFDTKDWSLNRRIDLQGELDDVFTMFEGE